jgi:apolipoprotein N-acyltransferase
LLAIIAGLALASSFPKIGISGLAWIAPGLMLFAALGTTGWQSFRIGYVAGLTHYLASLYWLLLIPYRWHGIPLGPGAGWLALSAYDALYPATWVWLLSRIRIPQSKLENAKFNFLPASWAHRLLWGLGGAALWVALEMIIARLFTGFPWNILGSSQFQLLPIIQISSVTGIYGVSFLLVWVSLSLLSATLGLMQRPQMRSAWIGEIILPFGVVAILFVVGLRQLQTRSDSTRTLRVTLVQPSIPQTVIWEESKDEERFAEILRLSQHALSNRTDLIIWPESAIPRPLRFWHEIFDPISDLARTNHVWMIVGSDDLEQKQKSEIDSPENRLYFNSSFLISSRGKLMEDYRKHALVIFGEYVPLARWLPFMKWFTPIEGQFTPGEHPVPFILDDLKVKTSVLICFEDIFPHLARAYAEPDTDFLVNLTNNGWFGEGAAQWQHAAGAVFRAIENRIPLVRCTNNGLTCWVDDHGRLKEFHDQKGTIYGPGFMEVEVPLISPGAIRSRTFYNQHGDVFGWLCVVVGAVMLANKLTQWRTRNRGATKGG